MVGTKLSAAVFGMLLVVLAALPAHALPFINGSYGIGGNFRWVDENGAPATLAGGAVALDFNNNSTADSGPFVVLNAAGDFASGGLVFGMLGTIKDIRYTGSGGTYPSAPLPGFQTVGGFTFDLSSIDQVTIDSVPSLGISGHGVFHHAGFADTAGTFTFSGQCASANPTSACTAFTFSASNVSLGTSRVPEPGTVLLLGLALIGVGGLRRRYGRK